MKPKKTFDILMGVGARFYPDPSYFIEEVLRLGLSKVMPDFPKYFSPAHNKLWLVHWKNRKIFGYVTGLCYRVYAPPESPACEEAKKRYGEENVCCIPYGAAAGDGALRGCGTPSPTKRYLKGVRRHGKQKGAR